MNRGGSQVIPRPEAWAPGRPAPWASAAVPDMVPLAGVVAALVAHGPPRPAVAFPDARQSAVLVALFDGAEGAEVVLTRRAWHLSNHKGEVSFPGGRVDPGESPQACARREAHEEVALDPASVTVVGELDHLATVVSRSLIVPVVATLPARPTLRPSPSEVDRVLTVPLVRFLEPGVFREERWGTAPLDRPVYFFELEDETVWGATARMLVQLLGLVTGTTDEVDGW